MTLREIYAANPEAPDDVAAIMLLMWGAWFIGYFGDIVVHDRWGPALGVAAFVLLTQTLCMAFVPADFVAVGAVVREAAVTLLTAAGATGRVALLVGVVAGMLWLIRRGVRSARAGGDDKCGNGARPLPRGNFRSINNSRPALLTDAENRRARDHGS